MNLHLLVTSRQEEDIESALKRWACIEDIVPIQSIHITDDIRGYIRARVRHDDGLQRWRSRPEVQEEIETILTVKADGM